MMWERRNATRSPVRVLLADSHPAVRAALREALDGGGIAVVGEAATGVGAELLAGDLKPDLVLLDPALPECGGVNVIAAIKARLPATSILVLAGPADPDHQLAAFVAGAAAYLIKGVPSGSLRKRVLAIRRGAAVLDGDRLRSLLEALEPDAGAVAAVARLSRRQQRVLQYIVAGCGDAEMSHSLGCAIRDVRRSMARIVERLDVSDRTQAALVGARGGLLPATASSRGQELLRCSQNQAALRLTTKPMVRGR